MRINAGQEQACWRCGLSNCSLTLPPSRQLQCVKQLSQLSKQQSCCRLVDTGQGALQLWPLRQTACNQPTAEALPMFRSVLSWQCSTKLPSPILQLPA